MLDLSIYWAMKVNAQHDAHAPGDHSDFILFSLFSATRLKNFIF